MTHPISVFLITHNEETRLERTLESVIDWADDVVVVDSGSDDRTVEIATELGARVFHNDWQGYGQQKRFAEDQCKHRWVLNIDADEVVTEKLREEIQNLLSLQELKPAAYKLPILTIYPGDERPRPLANDYNVVRFYNLDIGRYRDHAVYDRVELEAGAPVHQIFGGLDHHAIVDWNSMMRKACNVSNADIERLSQESNLKLKFRLLTSFPLYFLRAYITRRHFTGGWKGVVFSVNTANTRFMKVAKALELKEAKSEFE